MTTQPGGEVTAQAAEWARGKLAHMDARLAREAKRTAEGRAGPQSREGGRRDTQRVGIPTRHHVKKHTRTAFQCRHTPAQPRGTSRCSVSAAPFLDGGANTVIRSEIRHRVEAMSVESARRAPPHSSEDLCAGGRFTCPESPSSLR
jgi:sRNA-binding protein